MERRWEKKNRRGKLFDDVLIYNYFNNTRKFNSCWNEFCFVSCSLFRVSYKNVQFFIFYFEDKIYNETGILLQYHKNLYCSAVKHGNVGNNNCQLQITVWILSWQHGMSPIVPDKSLRNTTAIVRYAQLQNIAWSRREQSTHTNKILIVFSVKL